jgi:hypothetical protein
MFDFITQDKTMEKNEQGEQGQASAQDHSPNDGAKPKVVVVIFYPNGRTIINQVEPGTTVPDRLGEGAGRLITHLDLKTPPRRYQVLLEKWGKGAESSGINSDSVDVKTEQS